MRKIGIARVIDNNVGYASTAYHIHHKNKDGAANAKNELAFGCCRHAYDKAYIKHHQLEAVTAIFDRYDIFAVVINVFQRGRGNAVICWDIACLGFVGKVVGVGIFVQHPGGTNAYRVAKRFIQHAGWQ